MYVDLTCGVPTKVSAASLANATARRSGWMAYQEGIRCVEQSVHTMVAGKSNRPEEPRHSALLHASKIREARNEGDLDVS
jgi:hypothetical protein